MAEEIKNENVVEGAEVKTEVETGSDKVETKTVQTEVDAQAQIQNLLLENARLKRQSDKNASEAADFKKKWKSSLSEVELASQERAEKELEREEKYNALLRENQINKIEKSYMSLKFTAEEASKIAIAEVDNDFEAKTRILAEVDARKTKELEAEWLKSRPSVNAGVGNEKAPLTKEQFEKLGYKEIVDFKNKYPETYKSYVSR